MTDGILKGKVALVTGGGAGIGAYIAEELAANGAFVWIADIDGDRAESVATHLPSACALILDTRDRPALKKAAETLSREHTGLDILVNNAGRLTSGPFDGTGAQAFDDMVATNLTGVFNTVQALVPLMYGRSGASIINLASVSASKGGGSIGNVWYGATKAAVIAITQGLARELGPRGIRANAIAPGLIETGFVREQLTPEVRTAALTRFPLGRFASTADVARLAVFLASDAAAFISGQSIAVDGGYLCT